MKHPKHVDLTPQTGPTHRLDKNYIYFESSNSNETQAAIYSPVYEPRDRLMCFTFHYNMNGASMGKLELYQVRENDELLSMDKLLLEISGNQGVEWHQAYVSLRQFNDSYQLVFQATRGSSYLSDIALDKFSLSQDIANCQLLKEIIEDKYMPVQRGK